MASAPIPVDGIPRKRCPFCAEMILDTDRKCGFCHEYLDPALRGKFAGGPAYWEGDFLRVPLGGFIRRTHCLVCARGIATTTKTTTFRHVPLWAWLLLPICYVGMIVIALSQERQEIDVPVCWDCQERWTRMTTMFRLYGVLALVALPVLFGFIGNNMVRSDGGFFGVCAGLMVWGWGLFGIHALGVRKCQPTCRAMDRTSALLRLPNAGALQTAWECEK